MTDSAAPLRIIEETPAYWSILFDNPPLNIVGAGIFESLQHLLARMDASRPGEMENRFGEALATLMDS